MRITSIHISIDGEVPGLRTADPVPITVHLPEGDWTVPGWCNEIRFDARWKGEHDHCTQVSFYELAERQPGQTDDELF